MRETRQDAKAWQTAEEQGWLISHEQLEEYGFSRGAIRHRIATKRLWVAFDRVYAVGNPDMTPERRAMAAVLACGLDAGLSHLSAAFHLSIWERRPPMHHVSIPSRRDLVVPEGIRLHRPRLLRPEEIIPFEGVRVTNLVRTITDSAGMLGDRGVRSMIRQAQREHGLELGVLSAYVDGFSAKSFRHRRVWRVLRDYVEAAALTATEREALMMDLCAQYGIPLPAPQVRIGRYYVDFLWREYRLIVELDDRASHATAIAFTDDRVRDRWLQARDYIVLRFTVVELQTKPAMVAAEIAAAIARLESQPA